MFRITTEDGKFDVRFRYKDVCLSPESKTHKMVWENLEFRDSPEAVIEQLDCKPVSIRTECIISRVDESKSGRDRYTPVTDGSVVCSLVDKFDKAKGRKSAFTKAMKNWQMSSKEFKREFWKAFFANHNSEKKYLTNIAE